jgi:hypothetical protein
MATLLSCLYRLQEDGFTHLRKDGLGHWWNHDERGLRPIADILIYGLHPNDGPPLHDPPAAIDHDWHVIRRPAPGLRFMSRRTPEYMAVRLESCDRADARPLSELPRQVQSPAPPVVGKTVWEWLRSPAISMEDA